MFLLCNVTHLRLGLGKLFMLGIHETWTFLTPNQKELKTKIEPAFFLILNLCSHHHMIQYASHTMARQNDNWLMLALFIRKYGTSYWTPRNTIGGDNQIIFIFWCFIIQDGIFELCLHFGEDYPYEPPTVKFVTEMFHPNVDEYGVFHLYNWSPARGVNPESFFHSGPRSGVQ